MFPASTAKRMLTRLGDGDTVAVAASFRMEAAGCKIGFFVIETPGALR